MRKIIFLALALLVTIQLPAQLNMTLRSHIEFGESANDIWGYTANDREYALVGLRTGVAVVDVTDPDNPVEMGKADGVASIWRDIKTWDGYAYVTTDSPSGGAQGEGILVINLNNLPNPITTDDWYYVNPSVPDEGTIEICHNIYIDEFGYAYLAGCDRNSGGNIFYDVFSNPGTMTYVGKTPPIYAHDAYAKNNKLYTSDIYAGEFSIYNVSNKANPAFLGSHVTEYDFTHNVWLSDDQTIAFTTDEKPNAPVGSYDVSDPNNIVPLFQFRPLQTLGDGVIPHNTHVLDDYLIISYYSDGCIIVDASEPDHLIEVGNFDTFLENQQGFNGAWGAYPYFPSGTIVVSDIGSGLYVMTPEYKRAARLKGIVRDEVTNETIVGVTVVIQSDQTNFTDTDFQGAYKTGLGNGGNYVVSFSKTGYNTKSISLDLVEGEILELETFLQPISSVVTGSVVVDSQGDAIPGAQISFKNFGTEYISTANASGQFTATIPEGLYEVVVGAWGYKYYSETVMISAGDNFTYNLTPGYEDNFALDLGWMVEAGAESGNWVRAEPIGTTYQGAPAAPELDLQNDLSDQCYVTGNGGGTAGSDDVDNGVTQLISPLIDFTSNNNPEINFSYWWFNSGGQGSPNDALKIALRVDGSDIVVDEISGQAQWESYTFKVRDFTLATDNVSVVFETSDMQDSGHLVEAAIDGFSITQSSDIFFPPFAFSTNGTCVPFELSLMEVTDSVSTWAWTIESGSTVYTSEEKNPTVLIEESGLYSVTLVATVGANSYTLFEQGIVVAEDVPEIAGFGFTVEGDGNVSFFGNATHASSISWDFGDGNTSTQLNPVHVYSVQDSTVEVSFTATNSCGTNTVTQTIPTGVSTGLIELNSSDYIQVSPNPFTSSMSLSFDLSNIESSQLEIVDAVGRIIQVIDLEKSSGTLSLGDELSAGLYYLRILSNDESYAPIKMIKVN